MKLKKRIWSPLLAVILVFALFMATGLENANASTYYYFKTPSANQTFKAGTKIPVSFYAGIVRTKVTYDAWGNPETKTYEEMPITLKVFKGNTEVYSQDYTYNEATTISTTYTPTVTGTLKLRIYGCNMDLNSQAQFLQDTLTIKVSKAKPSIVKKIKPEIEVDRSAKKAATIKCINNYGYGMKIYRATKKNGKYKLIKTTSKSSYTDKSLARGSKVYYYKVRLHSKSGKKKYLSKYSAAVMAEKYIATTDTSPLKVVAANTSKGVKISWKKYDKAGYYLVARSTTKTGEKDVFECLSAEDVFTYDKDAVKGKTYYYTVEAWYGNDQSPLIISKPVKLVVK